MGLGWDDVGFALNPTAWLATGAQFAGDYLAQQEQKEADSRNRAAQERMNERNIQAQKEFAQMGVRWRVDDAKAAGLHPLAALGAAGSAFSPSFQAFNESAPKADMYRNMGQNISRAIAASSTAEERMMRKLQIERMQLENYVVAKQAGLVPWVGQVGPGFPADGNSQIGGLSGQGDASLPVQIMPLGRTASPAGMPHQAYGSTTEYSFTKMPDGSLKLKSSPDIQGDKANDLISMLSHHIDRIAALYGNPAAVRPSSQDHPLPPGYEWEFRYHTGRFHPVKSGTKRPWYRRLLDGSRR